MTKYNILKTADLFLFIVFVSVLVLFVGVNLLAAALLILFVLAVELHGHISAIESFAKALKVYTIRPELFENFKKEMK